MALELLALAMYISCIFHVVCASFSALAMRKLADAEANSSGIWALVFIFIYPNNKYESVPNHFNEIFQQLNQKKSSVSTIEDIFGE